MEGWLLAAFTLLVASLLGLVLLRGGTCSPGLVRPLPWRPPREPRSAAGRMPEASISGLRVGCPGACGRR